MRSVAKTFRRAKSSFAWFVDPFGLPPLLAGLEEETTWESGMGSGMGSGMWDANGWSRKAVVVALAGVPTTGVINVVDSPGVTQDYTSPIFFGDV